MSQHVLNKWLNNYSTESQPNSSILAKVAALVLRYFLRLEHTAHGCSVAWFSHFTRVPHICKPALQAEAVATAGNGGLNAQDVASILSPRTPSHSC